MPSKEEWSSQIRHAKTQAQSAQILANASKHLNSEDHAWLLKDIEC